VFSQLRRDGPISSPTGQWGRNLPKLRVFM